jgi:hypothetical protein
MRKSLAIALLSVLALIGSASFARAFVVGWTLITPHFCQGLVFNGVNYLIIYPTIGGSLTTSDNVTITLVTPYCTSGGSFWAYTPDGSTWAQIATFP